MFTIGEFARFGGLSVRMLRHYDQLGILKPARVDPETGYRYYSAYQLPALNRLLALRGLGFSLAEIERILADVTVDELRGMLTLRRSQLQADVDAQLDRLAAVEARLRLIEKEGHMPSLEVITKQLPAERVIALKAPAPHLGPANLTDVVTDRFNELIELISHADIEAGSPAFCFFSSPSGDEGERYVHCAVPVHETVTTAPEPAELLYLPPVEHAATAIWQGRMADYHPYPELAQWLEDHDLTPVGDGRDRFIQLETEDQPSIIEIHWPVKGPDSDAPDITPRRVG